MTTTDRMEAATDWYNTTSKAALIEWANQHNLDIGQSDAELADDWNARVIEAYAAAL